MLLIHRLETSNELCLFIFWISSSGLKLSRHQRQIKRVQNVFCHLPQLCKENNQNKLSQTSELSLVTFVLLGFYNAVFRVLLFQDIYPKKTYFLFSKQPFVLHDFTCDVTKILRILRLFSKTMFKYFFFFFLKYSH